MGERSPDTLAFEAGIRRRSVDRLGRLNLDEAKHSQHVAFLALRLFDETKRVGLHEGTAEMRELLEYAGLLHDLGVWVSHGGHHRHSYYLIRHSDHMAGFTDEEIEVIGNLAYFHRKSPPRKRHLHFGLLSVFLRIAEGLDRSHLGVVRDVSISRDIEAQTVTLTIDSAPEGDANLEQWYVASDTSAWQEAFGTSLVIAVKELAG